MARIICGVDISSRTLDVCLGGMGLQAQFANSSEGIAQLGALCLQNDVELVAMEVTGGYEQKALHGLSSMGLPVAILNPRAVRQFAQSMGRLEKTDAIDAAIIAQYAAVRKSKPVLVAPARQQQLRALVTRLRQLTGLRTAQRNPARLVEDELVRRCFLELLSLVDAQIGELEQQIAARIASDPLWRQLDPVLRTIKGVADRTVARLFAELPELGTLPNKTVAKLAGLAPLARDAGQFQGKRHVRGGRAPVREILFIVGSVVARYEPDFVAFQDRLRQAGKPPKEVRIAVAHKLLTRLNAKARDLRQGQPSAAQQAEAA